MLYDDMHINVSGPVDILFSDLHFSYEGLCDRKLGKNIDIVDYITYCVEKRITIYIYLIKLKNGP